jgi:hypothetical protein
MNDNRFPNRLVCNSNIVHEEGRIPNHCLFVTLKDVCAVALPNRVKFKINHSVRRELSRKRSVRSRGAPTPRPGRGARFRPISAQRVNAVVRFLPPVNTWWRRENARYRRAGRNRASRRTHRSVGENGFRATSRRDRFALYGATRNALARAFPLPFERLRDESLYLPRSARRAVNENGCRSKPVPVGGTATAAAAAVFGLPRRVEMRAELLTRTDCRRWLLRARARPRGSARTSGDDAKINSIIRVARKIQLRNNYKVCACTVCVRVRLQQERDDRVFGCDGGGKLTKETDGRTGTNGGR